MGAFVFVIRRKAAPAYKNTEAEASLFPRRYQIRQAVYPTNKVIVANSVDKSKEIWYNMYNKEKSKEVKSMEITLKDIIGLSKEIPAEYLEPV